MAVEEHKLSTEDYNGQKEYLQVIIASLGGNIG